MWCFVPDLSLTILFSKFTHVACSSTSLFLKLNNISLADI
jgi:hypothetical protein